MNITGVSMFDTLASQATNLQSDNMGLKMATTMMKKVMDSQEQMGKMLVNMIQQTPTGSVSGTGSIIDIRA